MSLSTGFLLNSLKRGILKKVAQIADNNDDITMGDINFKHSQKEEYEKKVKLDSLKNVEDHKLQYETALGLTLTPIGIENLQTYSNATEGAAVVEEVVVTGIRESKDGDSRSYSQDQRDNTTFEEIEYSAKVVVQYAVETKPAKN